tara:strand:- start:31 stop:354 length:324 start_codon:yes stop_codon:yes gene_type:complete
MEKIITYDSEQDILSIHKEYDQEEKFKGNIDIGDFILDISTKGTVKGLEILNASDHFQQFGITKKILENTKEIKFIVQGSKTGIMIAIKFDTPEKKIPASFVIPIEN